MKNDRIHPIVAWVVAIGTWILARCKARQENKLGWQPGDSPAMDIPERPRKTRNQRDIKAISKAKLKAVRAEIDTYARMVHSHRPEKRFKPDTQHTETT